jgi:hypothetical protein
MTPKLSQAATQTLPIPAVKVPNKMAKKIMGELSPLRRAI